MRQLWALYELSEEKLRRMTRPMVFCGGAKIAIRNDSVFAVCSLFHFSCLHHTGSLQQIDISKHFITLSYVARSNKRKYRKRIPSQHFKFPMKTK